MRATPPEHVQISAAQLAVIQDLYDRGLMLQAWDAVQPLGPLAQWTGPGARTMAGRLAFNLGASRLGMILHWREWREQKSDPDAAAYYAHGLLQRRGPLAAWEFLGRHSALYQADPSRDVAHLFTVQAMVLGHLRDFSGAQKAIANARSAAPSHPWVAVAHSHVLESMDHYEAALETAREALHYRPWFRPAVQSIGHLLQILDRDEEALEFLAEANTRLENCHALRQLIALEAELGRWSEAMARLPRFEQLAPLMEKGETLWLKYERMHLACLGMDAAAVLAAAPGLEEEEYFKGLLSRVKTLPPQGWKRVHLQVPFVRQHHMTCAPATLSAISRFWGQPAEHLEVAEAICYDGTPAHSERHWAETHGWSVREFTVTWDAARTLLDRGIPFTVTTTETTSAHLQAAVGYDEVQQTLWIRDPFLYYFGQFRIEPFLKRYEAHGPRGMALVPVAQAKLLEDIELPDAVLYDHLHAIQQHLVRHARPGALAELAALETTAPGHRLSLLARRALASYDSNTPALLTAYEQLLNLYPENGSFALARLACLRDLSRRADRLRLFEEFCSHPKSDPIFWLYYANELRADARELERAAQWIRWGLRYRPADPAFVAGWADVLWERRQFQEALPYYRLAACLGEKSEGFSRSYFVASRHLRLADETLGFLGERSARLNSPAPAITLVEAFQQLARTKEAFQTLETALQRRPQDGSLRLFAADFHARYGRVDLAEKFLEEARDKTPHSDWLRSAATLQNYRNEKTLALRHWQEVLELEPLSYPAHQAIALLLAETQGRDQALQFLDAACAKFPFSCPLLSLRIRWLSDEGSDTLLPALRQYLEINPADSWGWRELALCLSMRREFAEAHSAAEEAIRLEPNSSYGYSVRAQVHRDQGQSAQARQDFRRAIGLEVDNTFALDEYVRSGSTLTERKEALAEVAAELRRQVIFAHALHAYQGAARGLLSAEEMLTLLEEAHTARPDLWQSWSVLIGQLVDMGRYDRALQLATAATERFPLQPQLWVDLARVHQASLRDAEEEQALKESLQIDPGFVVASRTLAELYERQNELDKALKVIDRALFADPLEAELHSIWARLSWVAGRKPEAIARLQHALALQPGMTWGWDTLRAWGEQTGQPQLAATAARELTRRRGGEARSWLILARSLDPMADAEETRAATDRALALNPLAEDAFDLRAVALARNGRFDEALKECAPGVFAHVPVKLKLRHAWIEHERGNALRAINLAKKALAEHPDYYAGWKLLVEWYWAGQQVDEAIEAAEKMVALAPLNPVPLGYLGDMKQQGGDIAGAEAAFERAFRLDPDYEFAGYRLFDCYLDVRAFDKAQATLAILSRKQQSADTLSCAIRLSVARGFIERALTDLRQLLQAPNVSEWNFSSAITPLDRDAPKKVTKLLDEAIRSGNAPSALAEYWVTRSVTRNRWRCLKLIEPFVKSEAGRAAMFRFLEQLGDAIEQARESRNFVKRIQLQFVLRGLMKRHADWMRQDVQAWAKVGYVYVQLGAHAKGLTWMGDWKERKGLESWMLVNCILMFQHERRCDEAVPVIREAVKMRLTQSLFPTFTLWAAFEEALAGNHAAAQVHLAALSDGTIKPHLEPLRVMTSLLLALPQAQAAGEIQQFPKRVRRELKTAFGSARPAKDDIFSRRAFDRFLKTVSLQTNSRWLRLWGSFKYNTDIWAVALIIPAILFALGILSGLQAMSASPIILVVLIALLIHRARG